MKDCLTTRQIIISDALSGQWGVMHACTQKCSMMEE